MNCINNAIGLFQGPNSCAAITIAVVAFVLGACATCLLCKWCRPCGTGTCKQAKPANTHGTSAKSGEERPFEKRKPHPAPADGSVEIYVGNLSYDVTEEQLKKEFSAYGTVKEARLVINRYNGKSKGFGFVHMPVRAEAEKAIAALNDKELLGRCIKCNEAKNVI